MRASSSVGRTAIWTAKPPLVSAAGLRSRSRSARGVGALGSTAAVRTGVSADRIETGGFAAERAKCSGSTEQCAQRDGRVEVLARSSN